MMSITPSLIDQLAKRPNQAASKRNTSPLQSKYIADSFKISSQGQTYNWRYNRKASTNLNQTGENLRVKNELSNVASPKSIRHSSVPRNA